MPTPAEKRAAFQHLHERGCWVLPNPWDVGSAKILQSLGFGAVASTSSGMAWSMGGTDYDVSLEACLAHLALLSAAVDIPLNADFENGFADAPEGVAENVRRALDAGVAGLSIEDTTRRPGKPVYEAAEVIDRIKAARAAIDAHGPGAVLVGRADGLLMGHMDAKAAIDRAVTLADAGADCIYVPGLRTPEDIAALVKAVAPKPVNVLAGFVKLDVAGYADLGVRRISVGGSLARAAWGGFLKAARQMKDDGRFDALADGPTGREMAGLLKA